jgi:heptosyltransferase-2
MHADEALLMTRDETYKQRQKKSWSEVLYGMLGERYAGQPYMLGYRPKTRETYDIGLNHHVGSKFPNKRWPEENWNRLAEMLAPRYSVDWQRSMNELEGYMDWINSCLTIVTNDSLGLHIALALGKNVVALFGPTLASEVHDRPNLCKIVSPNRHLCADCSEARCVNDPGCMAGIPVEEVLNEVEALSFDQLRSNVHKIPAKGVA